MPAPAPTLRWVIVSLAVAAAALTAAQPPDPWPQAERDHRPWTRWWWPASAVDKASLTRQLEQFAAANLGGVEITPIYGAKGYEDRSIDFLSPAWMEMIAHVGREAQRLGLGVDMATGTGWPFGGPSVRVEDASSTMALVDGRLGGVPTKMQVKRAAPGGEGLVLDPYSSDALQRYLAPFTKAFAACPRGLLRGQFHDSFEYYGASWTPNLPDAFQRMHGYEIRSVQTELLGGRPADADALGRMKSDYRETLAAMHLEYLDTWVRWSHALGFLTRNQSHGAPANILDLYGRVDIPETELFGSTPFPIPGLRRLDAEVRHDQDLPESLVIRMASSAAHVMGRRLASSESSTWLREHWKEALSYAKPELDRVLLDGINHIVYHGSAYSPGEAPWPGWLFYASTQYHPRNTWWDDFGAMNRYIERVQSVLQHGRPDNDVLLYWPVFDLWDNPEGLVHQLGVHDVKWLTGQPVGRIAKALQTRGYGFDYISDAQLSLATAAGGDLATPGSRYRVLIVPAVRRMPATTLAQMLRLAESGATVVFESLPEDVPGHGRLAGRRERFRATLEGLSFASSSPDISEARVGRGRILLASILSALPTLPVVREAIADTGAGVIRRAHPGGHDYFFANLTGTPIAQWVALGVEADSAVLLDPLTGAGGNVPLRTAGSQPQVYLQLAPGESLILRTASRTRRAGGVADRVPLAPPLARRRGANATRDAGCCAWAYVAPAGLPLTLAGPWQVQFVKGGPALPPPAVVTELRSWTDLGGEAQRFAGTARYRIEFDLEDLRRRAPASVRETTDEWALDLGDVRESARVRLNGEAIATAWSVPFVVRLGNRLKPRRNVLELEVTNLAANRIRDMDQRGVAWKIMREINFVDINYRPFDASKWPVTPSGLLGPVRLMPLRTVRP